MEGMGDGLCLGMTSEAYSTNKAAVSGRNYLSNSSVEQFVNNTAFSILQATRSRVSQTEFIACPSCGRTQYNIQEALGRVKSATRHLKGLKIAVMGCIVNGLGEMADADYGYVGAGRGKVSLFRAKELVIKNIDQDEAVLKLIELIKSDGRWFEA